TPTGSTAYNKSIGGAVLHPRVEAMQMAEIASLNNIVYRTLGAPMIVAKKDSIVISPEDVEDYSVTVDQLTFNYEKIEAIE
ncbi:NAD(+)/NADH kinase, partial [Vibrio cholerae O1]|nr:NAD(+)/NADH kinase [Vibrio cholerae O1]